MLFVCRTPPNLTMQTNEINCQHQGSGLIFDREPVTDALAAKTTGEIPNYISVESDGRFVAKLRNICRNQTKTRKNV